MSTATTRKKTNKKTSKRKASKKVSFTETKIFSEIIGLTMILVGIYSFYSLMVSEPGTIGKSLYFLLYFAMGKASYIITFLLIILGIYFIMKGITYWKSIVLPMILFTVNISIFITIIDNLIINPVFSRQVLDVALNAQDGGGIIGIFLTALLVSLFSVKGTIIILTITTLISIILMTQKSLYDGYLHLKSAYNSRPEKSDASKIKEPKEETKPDKPLQDKNHDESVKNIKILDYSEVRSKKNKDPNDLKKTESEKNNHKIEEKISQLEEQTKSGPINNEYVPIKYSFPSLELLIPPVTINSNSKKEILINAKILEKTLQDFGVKAKVVEVSMGPSVTRYELQLEAGVKVSKIVNLSNDLALSLATTNVRIEAPIPGKAAVGIEVPNKDTAVVNIREVLESKQFKDYESKICFALGKELSGSVVVGDIAKMPHVLIAGATGSGKSVCINSIITSILYKASPEEVKLILIDPKMVELNNYNGIPHLLIPVVTDPKHASGALNWAIKEMTERYKLFKDSGVRDINRYNEVVIGKDKAQMPRIVIIIDELADLMMVSPREVENAICRLAQLARAAGIHLVLATQRPSVDVITGLIKANVPSRISFAVSSMVDSRTILDVGGAEKLLGRGDMLYNPVGESKPIRIQGTFISDTEVEEVVNFVKKQGEVNYNEKVIEEIKDVNVSTDQDDFEDDMMPQALALTLELDNISTSMIQRKLRVGYSRAGRIIDEMESKGIISGPEGSKPRKVLISKDEYDNSIKKNE
ncbi:hypothetical protein GC105_08450 [Alkalibaculum sp. M08DMB]|uniref:FtsK domain-containing protein n=1 Tax=Alkalibaculum sporogenes TaxID=2655001 RepID=A0A6A7K8M0_9FIRM|nr:DNA translocase FtsK [Alkalibaculum sporogenes]MPW25818.1 hypothetical protein [Alkalibaculum sporogenes]